ncbi:MAG: hypothetical protein ACTXOO_00800 [Sodalis sp. (in: enterobacteria)]
MRSRHVGMGAAFERGGSGPMPCFSCGLRSVSLVEKAGMKISDAPLCFVTPTQTIPLLC